MATRTPSLRKRGAPPVPKKDVPVRLKCVGCPLSLSKQPYAELLGGRGDCACTLCLACFSLAQAQRSAGVELACPHKSCDRRAAKWRIHPFRFTKPDERPPPVEHAIRPPATAEDCRALEAVLALARRCRIPGCDRRKERDGGDYCAGCAGIGRRLAEPVAAADDPRARKPAHGPGDRVVAAYWDPEDMDREEAPVWKPGVVTHVRERDAPRDETYGPSRRYNVRYDLGDYLRGLDERHVCAAEDHALRARLGVLGPGGGTEASAATWRAARGVRCVADRRSADGWARHVGWYVATVDGARRECATLRDAMRAVDAATVRQKGLLTQEGDLHFPEDWPELFRKEAEAKAGPPPKKRKGKAEAEEAAQEARKAALKMAQDMVRRAQEGKSTREESDVDEISDEEELSVDSGGPSTRLPQDIPPIPAYDSSDY